MIQNERAHAPSAPRQKPIPRLDGGLPLIGHVLELRDHALTLLERGHRRYGAVFQLKIGGRDVVVFAGPDAHRAFFEASESHLARKSGHAFIATSFEEGLSCVRSERLDPRHLEALECAQSTEWLATRVGAVHAAIDEYLDSWGDQGEVELGVALREMATSTAWRALAGQRPEQSVDEGSLAPPTDSAGTLDVLGAFTSWWPLDSERRRARRSRRVESRLRSLLEIDEAGPTDADATPDSEVRGTIAEVLRRSNGEKLPVDAIATILCTALCEGQAATGTLGAWMGIELLRHAESLASVENEMRERYPSGRRLSYESLVSQTKLDNVVRESERMHPPLVMLAREVRREMRHDGFRVPKGTLALVSPGLSHRLPDVFASPHRFEPERFETTRANDSAPPAHGHPYAMIGFGGRRHRCLLHNFTTLQLKAIWTVLLTRYEMELATFPPSTGHRRRTTGTEEPCRIRYRRREQPLGEL